MMILGFVLIAGAFLVFAMVANNSWQSVWAKIKGVEGATLLGNPAPPAGTGNTIVPTPLPPDQGGPPSLILTPGSQGIVQPGQPTLGPAA